MMAEDGAEDPSLSYQPIPALGEMQGTAPDYSAQSYSAGQPASRPHNTDGSGGGGGGQPASRPAVQLPSITLDMVSAPVFILGLMAWHFFWVSWSNLGSISDDTLGVGWLPDGWFYYTYSLLFIGVWTAADSRPLPALAMVIFFAMSILCDYIFLGIYMPHAIRSLNRTDPTPVTSLVKNIRRFSFAAVIIHHLSKYLTVMVAVFAFRARGGQATLRGNSYQEFSE
eukprot:scpid92744/ scgid26370/ 